MSFLNKVTIIFIVLLFTAFGIVYITKTQNLVKKTGEINLVTVEKNRRIENIFNISFRSAEQIKIKFTEISPLFNIQRYLTLHRGDSVVYLMSKTNEVIGLRNLENDRQISSLFYVLNLVASNIFVYLAIMPLTIIQFAYVFFNYRFATEGRNKQTKVTNMVDSINQFARKNMILAPIFFLLFFFLFYNFAANVDAIVQPTYSVSVQKYLLNFIVLLLLIIFLLVNVYLERKIKKTFYE